MGKLVDSTCKVGVEIEIENAPKLREINSAFWLAKADGSLREGGTEIVLTKPLTGTKLVFALDEAFNVLLKKSMKCSPRTGIHVHLDAGDMTVEQIRNNCVAYALVEEPIFKWVGEYRESNNFCMPWYEAEADIEVLCDIFTNKARFLTMEARRLHRYSAMNLQALHKFGSIEYRHLKTTLDKNRVFMWINMLLSLKKYSMQAQSGEKILEIYREIGSKKFLKEVFGVYSSDLDHKAIQLGETIANDIVGYKHRVDNGGFFAHLFTPGKFPGFAKYLKGKQ